VREQGHPAGAGLLGSGLVVSCVYGSTPMAVNVAQDMDMVCVEIPGMPCGALACFSSAGAVRFVAELATGFADLARRTGKPAPVLKLPDPGSQP
jgi:hypothetical protein